MTDADLILKSRRIAAGYGSDGVARDTINELADALEQRSAQLETENEQHHTLQRAVNTLEAQLEAEHEIRRECVLKMEARADRLAGALALLQDGKRFAVTENIGHDWIVLTPEQIAALFDMKRCPVCGTCWNGDDTPDVCPTPHLHKRVWRCKVCGLGDRVHRMSGHPSRGHAPQMELVDRAALTPAKEPTNG